MYKKLCKNGLLSLVFSFYLTSLRLLLLSCTYPWLRSMYKKSCKNRLLSFVFFFLFNLFKVSLISLYLALGCPQSRTVKPTLKIYSEVDGCSDWLDGVLYFSVCCPQLYSWRLLPATLFTVMLCRAWVVRPTVGLLQTQRRWVVGAHSGYFL